MKKIFSLLLVLVALSATTNTVSLVQTANAGTVYASSTDWDDVLDDFEDYVDDYIVVMKKAKAGDMTALTKSASMLKTANSLNEKLKNADSDLSAQQMSRYLKIVQKLSSAAMTL